MGSFQEINLPFLEAAIFISASFKSKICCCNCDEEHVNIFATSSKWVGAKFTHRVTSLGDDLCPFKYWWWSCSNMMRINCANHTESSWQSRRFSPLSSLSVGEQFLVEKYLLLSLSLLLFIYLLPLLLLLIATSTYYIFCSVAVNSF